MFKYMYVCMYVYLSLYLIILHHYKIYIYICVTKNIKLLTVNGCNLEFLENCP